MILILLANLSVITLFWKWFPFSSLLISNFSSPFLPLLLSLDYLVVSLSLLEWDLNWVLCLLYAPSSLLLEWLPQIKLFLGLYLARRIRIAPQPLGDSRLLGSGVRVKWSSHFGVQFRPRTQVAGLIPGCGVCRRQLIAVSFSHRCFCLSLFLPSSLSKINKHILRWRL